MNFTSSFWKNMETKNSVELKGEDYKRIFGLGVFGSIKGKPCYPFGRYRNRKITIPKAL